MKFNFYEGCYRIFVLISFVTGILLFIYVSSEQYNCFWGGILAGIAAWMFCYFLYFVIEWIIIGFTGNNIEETGIKFFIKKGIKKLINVNYAKPFYFILILLIPLTIADVYYFNNSVKYNDLKTENEILYYKNNELENKNQELHKKNIELMQKTEQQLPVWGHHNKRLKAESIEEYDKADNLSKKDIEQIDKLTGQ